MARILVTRISSFGDVAMLVPVIYSVAAKYPQDRFVVLTRKSFAPLFDSLSFNIGVRVLDVDKHHKGILGILRLLLSLTKSNYSHMADVHDVLRTKIIRIFLMLQGKKVAHICKGRAEKKEMIRTKIVFPPLKSSMERYMDVFEKLGYPAEMIFTNFFEFKSRSLKPFHMILSGATEKTGKWIGIAPFAKHRSKEYPPEKMEKVIYSLAKNPEYKIFLFGMNDRKDLSERWKSNHDNIIDVTKLYKLETELLLISYLDVMVSMDSANMHLASLVEVPVVSIWGATHPSLGFYGYKQDINNAVQSDCPCRPCSVFGDSPCEKGIYECMDLIEPSTVVDKIENVLSESRV